VLNVERETEETEIETLNDYLDVIRAATNKNKLTIKTTTQCCSCENAKMFFILSITCPKEISVKLFHFANNTLREKIGCDYFYSFKLLFRVYYVIEMRHYKTDSLYI
jgi:hypothetical protein